PTPPGRRNLPGIRRAGKGVRRPIADVLPAAGLHRDSGPGGVRMKVGDLQQHLADLGRLLEASGAKAVAADLAAIRDGLAPFRELPLKGFAEFLVRAEAYSRGDVPAKPPKGGRTGAKSAGKSTVKAPPPDAGALAREARELYDRVADPAVTAAQIDAL